jgi:hypothetical protein
MSWSLSTAKVPFGEADKAVEALSLSELGAVDTTPDAPHKRQLHHAKRAVVRLLGRAYELGASHVTVTVGGDHDNYNESVYAKVDIHHEEPT